MTEEELLALYALVRKEAESMSAREAALAQRTAALNQAIAKLEQLPITLGKQTGEYIAMGVRQSIQDDFSRPIEDAVKGPLKQFESATSSARHVMADVGKEARYRTWRWVAIWLVLGAFIGGFIAYVNFERDVSKLSGQLYGMQQQIAVLAMRIPPKPDSKKISGSLGKH